MMLISVVRNTDQKVSLSYFNSYRYTPIEEKIYNYKIITALPIDIFGFLNESL